MYSYNEFFELLTVKEAGEVDTLNDKYIASLEGTYPECDNYRIVLTPDRSEEFCNMIEEMFDQIIAKTEGAKAATYQGHKQVMLSAPSSLFSGLYQGDIVTLLKRKYPEKEDFLRVLGLAKEEDEPPMDPATVYAMLEQEADKSSSTTASVEESVQDDFILTGAEGAFSVNEGGNKNQLEGMFSSEKETLGTEQVFTSEPSEPAYPVGDTEVAASVQSSIQEESKTASESSIVDDEIHKVLYSGDDTFEGGAGLFATGAPSEDENGGEPPFTPQNSEENDAFLAMFATANNEESVISQEESFSENQGDHIQEVRQEQEIIEQETPQASISEEVIEEKNEGSPEKVEDPQQEEAIIQSSEEEKPSVPGVSSSSVEEVRDSEPKNNVIKFNNNMKESGNPLQTFLGDEGKVLQLVTEARNMLNRLSLVSTGKQETRYYKILTDIEFSSFIDRFNQDSPSRIKTMLMHVLVSSWRSGDVEFVSKLVYSLFELDAFSKEVR